MAQYPFTNLTDNTFVLHVYACNSTKRLTVRLGLQNLFKPSSH